MKTTGTMRALDDSRGAVRVEHVYDTTIDDLWQACTEPQRLARWIATVSGEPSVGAIVHVVFTSTWAGPAKIEVCDAPHHLLLTTQPGTADEAQLEAWLTAQGPRTRLAIEERGLPRAQLHFYAAGWQVHLEDLERALATDRSAHPDGWSEQAAAPAWHERWTELTPMYEGTPVLPG